MEYKRLNTLIKSLDETKRMAMSMYQEDRGCEETLRKKQPSPK